MNMDVNGNRHVDTYRSVNTNVNIADSYSSTGTRKIVLASIIDKQTRDRHAETTFKSNKYTTTQPCVSCPNSSWQETDSGFDV